MQSAHRFLAVGSILVSIAASAATPLPTTAPEKVGFSTEGLARIAKEVDICTLESMFTFLILFLLQMILQNLLLC